MLTQRLSQFVSSLAIVLASLSSGPSRTLQADETIRAGIIGCDTSHVVAFTKLINAADATGPRARVEVVAAYPGGSDDIPSSRDRVDGFVKQLREMDVEIVESIDALLKKVDVVLLESVDGRKHLQQVAPVFAAKKPVFIDKPLAGNLEDAVRIVELAKKHDAPWFTSSSLRFGRPATELAKKESLGEITGCDVYAPCNLEPHHVDLYWYGVHGVETLFTIMGPGCERVSRVHTEGTDVAVGVWNDGRIGVFRGIREGKQDYGATAYGTKGIASLAGAPDGYAPLVEEICEFFVSGKAPVDPAITLEMFAFMTAADESKRLGGASVRLDETLDKAKSTAEEKTQ